jgi:hypothetical protein
VAGLDALCVRRNVELLDNQEALQRLQARIAAQQQALYVATSFDASLSGLETDIAVCMDTMVRISDLLLARTPPGYSKTACDLLAGVKPSIGRWIDQVRRAAPDADALSVHQACSDALHRRYDVLVDLSRSLPVQVENIGNNVATHVFFEEDGVADDDPDRVCDVCMTNLITRETEIKLSCGCTSVCLSCLYQYISSQVRGASVRKPDPSSSRVALPLVPVPQRTLLSAGQVNDALISIPYRCPTDCGGFMTDAEVRTYCDEELQRLYLR